MKVGEEKEILYFKTEKERLAYLRNRIVIEPVEYVPEAEIKVVETTDKPKQKRGKKKDVAKEVQTD